MSTESFSTSLSQLLAELERLRVAAHRLTLDASRSTTRELTKHLPPEAQQLGELLDAARAAMLQDPIGAQAAVRFLTEQGKAYSQTEEGAQWLAALQASPLVGQLRLLWDASTLGVFDQDVAEDDVPMAWVDMISDVISAQTDIESLLAALNPGRRP